MMEEEVENSVSDAPDSEDGSGQRENGTKKKRTYKEANRPQYIRKLLCNARSMITKYASATAAGRSTLQMMVVYTNDYGRVRMIGKPMLLEAAKTCGLRTAIRASKGWDDGKVLNSSKFDEPAEEWMPKPKTSLDEINDQAQLEQLLDGALREILGGRLFFGKKPEFWPPNVDYVNVDKLFKKFKPASGFARYTDLLQFIIRFIYWKMDCYHLLRSAEPPPVIGQYPRRPDSHDERDQRYDSVDPGEASANTEKFCHNCSCENCVRSRVQQKNKQSVPPRPLTPTVLIDIDYAEQLMDIDDSNSSIQSPTGIEHSPRDAYLDTPPTVFAYREDGGRGTEDFANVLGDETNSVRSHDENSDADLCRPHVDCDRENVSSTRSPLHQQQQQHPQQDQQQQQHPQQDQQQQHPQQQQHFQWSFGEYEISSRGDVDMRRLRNIENSEIPERSNRLRRQKQFPDVVSNFGSSVTGQGVRRGYQGGRHQPKRRCEGQDGHELQGSQAAASLPVEKISDDVIDQYLEVARSQFSLFRGLMSPAILKCPGQAAGLMKRTIKARKIVQIHHIADHWIASAYFGNGHVIVYDSSKFGVEPQINRLKHYQDLRRQIIEVYGHLKDKKGELMVEVFRLPSQLGLYECGCYAIAYATDVLLGNKPETRKYVEHEIRNHMNSLISDGVVTQFPGQGIEKVQSDLIRLSVYCCYLSDPREELSDTNVLWVGCNHCEEGWYHAACAEGEGHESDRSFTCKKCLS